MWLLLLALPAEPDLPAQVLGLAAAAAAAAAVVVLQLQALS